MLKSPVIAYVCGNEHTHTHKYAESQSAPCIQPHAATSEWWLDPSCDLNGNQVIGSVAQRHYLICPAAGAPQFDNTHPHTKHAQGAAALKRTCRDLIFAHTESSSSQPRGNTGTNLSRLTIKIIHKGLTSQVWLSETEDFFTLGNRNITIKGYIIAARTRMLSLFQSSNSVPYKKKTSINNENIQNIDRYNYDIFR